MNASSNDRSLVVAMAAYVAMLAVLPLLLEAPTVERLFSEEGPFERLAIVGWIFAAGIVGWRTRHLGYPAASFAALFLFFAAREAEWHRAVTADSILKTNYYRHAAAPIAEKLVAGLVTLVIFGLLIHVAWRIVRFLLLDSGWRSRAGAWLLGSGLLMVATKVLDRLFNILANDFGIVVSPNARLISSAVEEGVEMLLPLVTTRAFWIAASERTFLTRSDAGTDTDRPAR